MRPYAQVSIFNDIIRTYPSKTKSSNQPTFVFNIIILLTLKIKYFLTIYINHPNDLNEFQVKYSFLNVSFTYVNLHRKFYIH
jgi:hypothetical protein